MDYTEEIEKLTEELAKARYHNRYALSVMIAIQIEKLKAKEAKEED